MSNDAARELSLNEWVGRLFDGHTAVVEYKELQAKLKAAEEKLLYRESEIVTLNDARLAASERADALEALVRDACGHAELREWHDRRNQLLKDTNAS